MKCCSLTISNETIYCDLLNEKNKDKYDKEYSHKIPTAQSAIKAPSSRRRPREGMQNFTFFNSLRTKISGRKDLVNSYTVVPGL